MSQAQASPSFSGVGCSPDTEPPVVTCPASFTTECVFSGQHPLPSDLTSVNDNCGFSYVSSPPQYVGTQATFTGTIGAVDTSGNSASCSTVWHVVDTHPPTLTLFLTSQPSRLPVGSLVDEPAYIAYEDGCDYTFRASAIQRSGSVNVEVPGTYTLTYSASDLAGNKGSASRQVTIIPFQASVTAASNTPQPRMLHTSTLLKTGRVLVTGGFNTAAEEYDPQLAAWSSVDSSLATHRGHTASVLGNGKVLLAGGASPTSEELYDPDSKHWSLAGAMSTPRFNAGAAVLSNGAVMVTGGGTGESSGPVLASSEVYDPSSDRWSPAASLNTARRGHTMTLLKNGAILVTGGTNENGDTLASSELYDPGSGTWKKLPDMHAGRALHTATLLSSGKVLVVGGSGQAWTQNNSTELFDPATSTWTSQGSMSNSRQEHTATRMIGDLVVVNGGFSYQSGIQASSEVYDPTTGAWRSTTALNVARYKHTATALDSYTILVVGGANGTNQSAVDVFKVAP